ncbi:MAG: hypothetical protein ACR2JV_01960 [Gaiellales bacterium]
MARSKRGPEIHVDDSDVQVLFSALKNVQADLRKNTNAQLRAAAKDCATALRFDLYQAIPASPAPQTALVASSIKVKSDRTPVVTVGGTKRVGRAYKSRKGGTKRAVAGALLWGVEYGDKHGRFAARNTNGHWIKPTVKRFGESSKAIDIYKRAVVDILKNAGVI